MVLLFFFCYWIVLPQILYLAWMAFFICLYCFAFLNIQLVINRFVFLNLAALPLFSKNYYNSVSFYVVDKILYWFFINTFTLLTYFEACLVFYRIFLLFMSVISYLISLISQERDIKTII